MDFALLLWLAAFVVVFVPTLLVLRRRPDWRRRITPSMPYLFFWVAACCGYVGARAAHQGVLNLGTTLAVSGCFLILGIRELVCQKKNPGAGPAGDGA
jgi:uncharacterized membrane protein YhaH (DUF805 family)